MNIDTARFLAGIVSSTLALLCACELLYYSVTGKGTDRDLLITVSMLLIAIYGRQK